MLTECLALTGGWDRHWRMPSLKPSLHAHERRTGSWTKSGFCGSLLLKSYYRPPLPRSNT